MSTPDRVIDTPTALVSLPPMPAQHVAVLIRGLRLYQHVQRQLHRLDITSGEAFTERHDPALAAEARLQTALDAWLTDREVAAPPDPGALEATWHPGPLLELGTLTLAQVWCLRLGTDWVFTAELDAARASGRDLDPSVLAPLRDAQQTLFATLRRHGVPHPE